MSSSSSSSPYIELHAHSGFSFLDGASHPEELVLRARELGYPALALTDHNGLYGSMEFAQAAKEEGIHPITGAEISIDPETVPGLEELGMDRRQLSASRGRWTMSAKAPMKSISNETVIRTMTGIWLLNANEAPRNEIRATRIMITKAAVETGISGQTNLSDSAKPKA